MRWCNRRDEREKRFNGFSDLCRPSVALPGGFGTLEEVLEIITLKQLRYHNKPVVILNTNGFFDRLLEQFDLIIEWRFAREECRELYFVTQSVAEAMDYIYRYVPHNYCSKWLTEIED
jgi:uncharacterized protein (TIGR00730 family)